MNEGMNISTGTVAAAPAYPTVPPNLLFPKPAGGSAVDGLKHIAETQATILKDTLDAFELPVDVRSTQAGPATTRILMKLGRTEKGKPVSVSNVMARTKDLAVELGTRDVRLVYPVQDDTGNSQQGVIGVEINHTRSVPVTLGEAMNSKEFRNDPRPLKFVVGMDVSGRFVVESVADMPHALVAGTTGSGKSIFLHAVIAQLLTQYTPEELQLILVDPKHVEFGLYKGLPHLYSPMTLLNQQQHGQVLYYAEDLMFALQYLIREMESRLTQFQILKMRDIAAYNVEASLTNSPVLPYMVLIVDEFAELFDAVGSGKEANSKRRELAGYIKRIAQKSRAAGIHLVLGTQRPSVDAIAGNIKTNFPARVAFRLPTSIDSEVVLDGPGAEVLRGKGDMLYQSPNAALGLQRLQGVFVETSEVNQVVNYWIPAASTP